MHKKTLLLWLLVVPLVACKESTKQNTGGQTAEEVDSKPKVTFRQNDALKKVDILIDGKPFTSYVFDGQTPKPILFPIISKSGHTVTRGFPYDPRPEERVDHPHHAGLWFNYGDVNGLDFWNNSYAIPEAEKQKYGTIVPLEITAMDKGKGTLKVKALWRSPKDVDLLEETTQFKFSEEGNTRFIDRTTTLKALEDVSFTDNKEGMLGIRVARQLELPSDEAAVFLDAEGNTTKVEALNNTNVTGDYLGSGGTQGNDVWGTRNDWVRLQGIIEGDTVSISILDHKRNVGYPTYWHARGYGLFAANPLGQAIFSEGKDTLNFKLKKSESVTFTYRIMVHDGTEITEEELNQAFIEFNGE